MGYRCNSIWVYKFCLLFYIVNIVKLMNKLYEILIYFFYFVYFKFYGFILFRNNEWYSMYSLVLL